MSRNSYHPVHFNLKLKALLNNGLIMLQVAYFADQNFMPTVTSGLPLGIAALQDPALPLLLPISTNCPHQNSAQKAIAKQRARSFQSIFENMTDKMVSSCTNINTHTTLTSTNKVQTNEGNNRCNSGDSANQSRRSSLPVIDRLFEVSKQNDYEEENVPYSASPQPHQPGLTSFPIITASYGKYQCCKLK